MRQPTTDFWMETRTRSRAAASPKTSAHPSPHRRRVYVLVPESPYVIPRKNQRGKGKSRHTGVEAEVSDDSEKPSPFQTRSAADSLPNLEFTVEQEDIGKAGGMELGKRRYNIHLGSQGRSVTEERMEELVRFRENHERSLKLGMIAEDSVVSIATERLGDFNSQRITLPVDPTSRPLQRNINPLATTSRDSTNPPVASSSRSPLQHLPQKPLPLDRLASLASVVPTEIADQDKLRQQWVEHQSTHPPSEGPVLPSDIIHAERSEMLRRYIQEQNE